LVKRFGATEAVNKVDLVVQEGEVRGLLGRNGAGKTTLLRLLFGLIAPDAGSIELLGRGNGKPGPDSLAGVAGFVENPCFYPYLSGRANLEVLAELDGDGAAARIDAVLETVMLGERGGDRVNGYSTGMRQRLGIAAALLRAPSLLLLDEPTSGLDPAGVRDVGVLVRQQAADGVAVVLSSHQIGELEQMCDSFTFLERGAVVWDGSAAELRAQSPASAYHLVTSDDAGALALAERAGGVRASTSAQGGLAVTAEEALLDRYVIALGQAGVAIRHLELVSSPLESMFFALTGESAAGDVERLPS
jgi:ABC-2 type transport system ATP-binding protein